LRTQLCLILQTDFFLSDRPTSIMYAFHISAILSMGLWKWHQSTLIMFFLVKSMYWLLDRSQRFGETCCLHLQGWSDKPGHHFSPEDGDSMLLRNVDSNQLINKVI
jgi:hypothetical protein